MNKERLQTAISACSLGVLASILFASPFSEYVKKKIGKRDNWTDVDTGEKFIDGVMVHASHYNHDKRNPSYDTPEQGRIQSVESHQQYHEEHVGNASMIGLTEEQNDFAIEKLSETDRKTREYRNMYG